MILVTGGTGTVGSATVRALRAGRAAFKVGTRDPGKAKANGTRAVELDFERPDTVAYALEKVSRVFSLTPVTEQPVRYVEALVAQAKRAGVKHLVRLSVAGADPASPLLFARQHGEAEEVVRSSGLEWTILRPTFFDQNFVNYYGVTPRADATVRLPHGRGKAAWVDARDVGEVAASVLSHRGHDHDGRTYELTGPEPLGDAEALAVLGEALGHTYVYQDVPPEDARNGMLGAGMPEWLVQGMMQLHGLIRDGHADATAAGVREALGREPRSFRDFARELANGAA